MQPSKIKTKNVIFRLGFVGSILYWVIESGLDLLVYEDTYWSRLVSPDSNELWMRISVCTLIFILSAYVQKVLGHEEELRMEILLSRQVVLDTISDALIQCDSNGMMIEWNVMAEHLFGWSKKEVSGSSFLETIISPRDHHKYLKILGQLSIDGSRVPFHHIELHAISRDGHEFPVDARISIQKKKTLFQHNVLLHDISKRREAERKLRVSSTVFDASSEAIMITDPNNKIISTNRAFTKITGYTAQEVVGENPKLLGSGRHPKPFYVAMWEAILTTGEWQGEIWDRKKNGEIYPKWLSITSVKDDCGNLLHYIGLFSDITRRKKEDESIYFRANHDLLTGLANRELFRKRLSESLERAANRKGIVAVFYIDLDHFKEVNDNLGHAVGDEILKMAADRLASCIRGNDTLARVGGDEFLIVLPDITKTELCVILADRILGKFSQPFHCNGEEVFLGTSIGIAIYPEDVKEASELIEVADRLMYQVKAAGGNNYAFGPLSKVS